jgi:hypothetical protein
MPERRLAVSETMMVQLPNPGHPNNPPNKNDLSLLDDSLLLGSALVKEGGGFILILKDRLADLEDLEQQGIQSLNQLCQSGQLSCEVITKALMFFNQMAEEVALTQRLLEDEVCTQARDSGYDGTHGWISHGLAGLSPEELLELKEELDQMIISAFQAAEKFKFHL